MLIRRRNPAGQVRCDKARMGERNGRTKLPDQNVVLMRLFRNTWEKQPSYGELAFLFGVHPRHAKRICMGEVRLEAGGPIEPEKTEEAVRYEDPPFDVTQVRRCSECGSPCHPAQIEPRVLCLNCLREEEVLAMRRRMRAMSTGHCHGQQNLETSRLLIAG